MPHCRLDEAEHDAVMNCVVSYRRFSIGLSLSAAIVWTLAEDCGLWVDALLAQIPFQTIGTV